MSVALKKIPGVESVEVSLNQGKAVVRFRSGNSARLEDLVQKVRDNGFTPKAARVVVNGDLVTASDKLQLKVAGISQVYDLSLDSKAQDSHDDLRRQAGKLLQIEGIIQIPSGKSASSLIQVKQWKIAPQAR